jgi:release factor glutamine methyltransferase
VNRRQALAQARGTLADNNIDDATLEGEILLRHVLGINRSQLFADLDGNVSPAQAENLEQLLERRLSGEPSAYITGHREFYGLDFKVNRHVLIPRPESELLVEKALSLCRSHAMSIIADIGTGCGAIAISLAKNLPSATIYATDISPQALEVAGENCRRHGVTDKVVLLQGDMLGALPEPVDLIVANLPYVREAELPGSGPLSFEPELALNGGKDGLDRIKFLCRQAGDKLRNNGSMLLEIGQGQTQAVKAIMHESFPSALIEIDRDLAGIERVISLRLT